MLKNQLRMKASKEIIKWIDDFTKEGKISKIPVLNNGYDIRVFDSPEKLEQAIKDKACLENHKLSRLIATYDWPYNVKSKPDNEDQRYWEVRIGNWHKPWNRELEKELDKKSKRKIKSLSWGEQPQTINEGLYIYACDDELRNALLKAME